MANQQPVMIFHAPYPMDPNPKTASRLRPLRMRQAFSKAGYRVIDVSGTVSERRKALKQLRQFLKNGGKAEFFYSENSTQPNLLATGIRNGFAPLVDFALMRTVARAKIPRGVFYRDVYWRFPEGRTPGLYGMLTRVLHRLDLIGYELNKMHFFLPSTPMRELIGLHASTTSSALWPGCEAAEESSDPVKPLRLVYVGGMGAHYRLDLVAERVKVAKNIHLELCVPKNQWEAEGQDNQVFASPNIHVHHLASKQLAPIYDRSSVGVLCVEPSEYRRIAVPVKLFEYLSYGRPIMAAEGTHAAQIVEQLGIGWVIPYRAEAIEQMLEKLANNPDEVARVAKRARQIRSEHTWLARAKTAADVLTGRSEANGTEV